MSSVPLILIFPEGRRCALENDMDNEEDDD